jgi:hypothetical protein
MENAFLLMVDSLMLPRVLTISEMYLDEWDSTIKKLLHYPEHIPLVDAIWFVVDMTALGPEIPSNSIMLSSKI